MAAFNDPIYNISPDGFMYITSDDAGFKSDDFQSLTTDDESDTSISTKSPISPKSDSLSDYSNDELLMLPRTRNQRTRKIHRGHNIKPPTTIKKNKDGRPINQRRVREQNTLEQLIMDVEDEWVGRGENIDDLNTNLNILLREENPRNNPIKKYALTVQYYEDVKQMMEKPSYEQMVKRDWESFWSEREKRKKIKQNTRRVAAVLRDSEWLKRYNDIEKQQGRARGIKKHRKSKKPRKFKKRKTKKRKTKKRKTKKRKTNKRKTKKNVKKI